MKITVWGINYDPEPTGIGPFNTDLCVYLAEQGHAVTMISTFPYYPWWKKPLEARGKLFERSCVKGVTLHRCWHYVPPKPSTLKRLLHELSFVATSTWKALWLPAPAIYVVVSPSLFLGLGAFLISRLKRRPFVFHVQDLQPDAALGLGMIKRGPAVRALYALESWTYTKAAAVSGICGGMLDAFAQKKVAAAKIIFFPNWIPDGARAPAASAEASFRGSYGIPFTCPLIAYSGNVGIKQGLEVVIEAASLSQEESSSPRARTAHWAICGEGAAKPGLEKLMSERGTKGVTLYPLQPDAQYHALLREADICLITQQRGTGQFFFPSKLLSILQYGRPVLAVADEASELARAVRAGRFGQVVEPGDATALLAAAEAMLSADAAQREEWASNGRVWVDQFRRSRVLGEFQATLKRLTSKTSAPAL